MHRQNHLHLRHHRHPPHNQDHHHHHTSLSPPWLDSYLTRSTKSCQCKALSATFEALPPLNAPSANQQCSEAKYKSMSYKSHLLDAKSKPTSCKSRSCPDYIISPLLLVADGQQERDEVPVNIWTQPTVRLTTYLMRMRTAVVIVKKSPIYRIKLLVSILS